MKDSFDWLDDDIQFCKEKPDNDKSVLQEHQENMPECRENINIAANLHTTSTKPVAKFRLSESFLLPISKSPPKPIMLGQKEKQYGLDQNINIPFIENIKVPF